MSRARETVREMFDRLGDSLLTLAAGTLDDERIIEEVVLQPAGEPVAVTSGAVVFGVGIAGDAALVCRLLHELGAGRRRGPRAPRPGCGRRRRPGRRLGVAGAALRLRRGRALDVSRRRDPSRARLAGGGTAWSPRPA